MNTPSDHEDRIRALEAEDVSALDSRVDSLESADTTHDSRLDALEGLFTVPVGAVVPYGGASAPTNFLLCDGSAVSRATYSGLYSAIGTAFGSGDGSTTFNLPDLRDVFPMGKSGTKALGSTGGSASVTLTTTELPAHTHSIDHGHPLATRETGPGSGSTRVAGAGGAGATSDTNTAVFDHSGDSGSAGTGSAFSVLNPYQALNYIICCGV